MESKPHKNLVVYGLIGLNGVSILGNALTEFAIPWLILQMTGSPTYVGILLGFKFIPIFISSVVGGGMIDRFGGVKTSKYSDLLNFAAVAAIPLLFVYDQLDMTLLLLLIFLSSLLDAPGRSAKDVLFANELDSKNLAKEKLNGFNSLVESLMDLLGPLLAGVLISLYGVVNLLWFDAFSFLIPLIGLIYLQKHLSKTADMPAQKANFKHFWQGFEFIYRHREMRLIVGLSAVISMAISVLIFIYLPIFANQILRSPIDQGIIMVFFATGTMSATLLYSFLGDRISYQALLSIGYAGLAVAIMTLNFANNLWLFAPIIWFVGLFLGYSGPLEATYLQRHVPKNLRGRVFAAYAGLRQLLVPLSMPLVGYYLEFIAPMQVVGGQVKMPNLMLFMGVLLLAMVAVYSWQFGRKTSQN